MNKLAFSLLGIYLNKEAAVPPIDPGHYNLKIPKGMGKNLLVAGLGVGAGVMGTNAYNDYRLGNQVRRQQG